jgi:Fe-S cluster assembly protein SufD
MTPVIEQGAREARFTGLFDALASTRHAEPSWLASLRRRAIDRFSDLGFPTTRDEEYRFTNIAPVADVAWTRVPADAAERVTPAALSDHTFGSGASAELVFVNGRFAPALSSLGELPEGLETGSLAGSIASADIEGHVGRVATADQSALGALNIGLFEDGAFVRIARGAVLDAPINLVFATIGHGAPAASFPRTLVLAGDHSQCRIIETYVGLDGGRSFTNAVTEIVCGADAVVDHYRVQHEAAGAFHYGSLQVLSSRGTVFSSHAFSMGGAIVRNDVGARLDGEGADCTLNGLYLADGDGLMDTHTTIDHARAHCGSHEVYKGILGGRSRGVFNGKIIVRQDAQKTDAKQTNKALLLSGAAQINTKPQLEIFADDVKCTHGATVGQLDPESLFYLRARGLGADEARMMLIRGFVGDIVNRVRFAPLRERLDTRLIAGIPRESLGS